MEPLGRNKQVVVPVATQAVHQRRELGMVSGVGHSATLAEGVGNLATLTLAHEERLDDVMAGYGGHIEIDVIQAYWSLRSLMEIRCLVSTATAHRRHSHKVAVLNSLSASS